VVNELEVVHPDRQIDLHFAPNDAVTCDVERITQLLSNLSANALTQRNDPEFVSAIHSVRRDPIARCAWNSACLSQVK